MTTESDNIRMLPVWKKGASAADFLKEVAFMAERHPERYSKVVVIFESDLTDKTTDTGYWCHNVSTTELMGLIEFGKDAILEFVKLGRRR